MDRDEDRVTRDYFVRHRRRHGAVLIVGTGAVGSLLADKLARLGYSPLYLLDKKKLEKKNVIRHRLGDESVGQPKARALADRLRRDFPFCDANGIYEDFLKLPKEEQHRLARQADVIVGAADDVDCQRAVNQVCIDTERLAVYPAVWVDPRVRDGEVGEILWVIPGRRTPCYACAMEWRQAGADTEGRGGTGPDMEIVAIAAAWVVAGLLEPDDVRSAILAQPRSCMYVHAFMPTSPAVQRLLPGGFRTVEVPFPEEPCPACHGHRRVRRPARRRTATTRHPPPPPPGPTFSFNVSHRHLAVTIHTSLATPSSDVAFQYSWGDGETTTTPSHTYAVPSVYVVMVTATNPDGSSTQRTRTISVTAPRPRNPRKRKPVLKFSVSVEGLQATVDTSGSSDASFEFRWGDQRMTRSPTHKYAKPGEYVVSVIAWNSHRSSSSTTTRSRTITVGAAPRTRPQPARQAPLASHAPSWPRPPNAQRAEALQQWLDVAAKAAATGRQASDLPEHLQREVQAHLAEILPLLGPYSDGIHGIRIGERLSPADLAAVNGQIRRQLGIMDRPVDEQVSPVDDRQVILTYASSGLVLGGLEVGGRIALVETRQGRLWRSRRQLRSVMVVVAAQARAIVPNLDRRSSRRRPWVLLPEAEILLVHDWLGFVPSGTPPPGQ